MNWSLLSEHGLVSPPPSGGDPPVTLRFPTHAEQGDEGTLLVVDERSSHKSVPIRSECRTLCVSRTGAVLYDSAADGIDDGDGRLMDEGRLALLRRTQWELLVQSIRGERIGRIPLWSFSKRWPRFVSWTKRGTFIGVFLDRAHLFDMVEFDLQGRLLWCLKPGAVPIGVPTSVQLQPDDRLLVADEFRHVVLELDRDGGVRWQHGTADRPSDREDALSSPRCAVRLRDGRRMIADTRNHRVLMVSDAGRAEPLAVAPEDLSSPTSVAALPGGGCLIADAGNGRIVEVDGQGCVVWRYGRRLADRRMLSFPRSVEPDGAALLVADTANNRIVRATAHALATVPTPPLFWPRSARRTPSGALLIADGRHSRVLEAGPGGVFRELRGTVSGGHGPFHDPHDAHELPNGHLLVVDPGPGIVMEIDWEGRVHWSCSSAAGEALSDPHSAQLLRDGTVLICDTGNHRLVWADRRGATVREASVLVSGDGRFRLNRPRHAHVSEEGSLVVTDTGNNRVLGLRGAAEVEWELTSVPGSTLSDLDQPRWARLVGGSRLLVCDHYHHRILQLERE